MRGVGFEHKQSCGRRLWLRVAAGVALLGIATGCSSTGPVTSVFAAIVYGVVTDAEGRPQSGVVIQSQVFRPDCITGQLSGSASPTQAVTDANGRFSQQVLTAYQSSLQCIRVSVRQSDGTMKVGTEVTGVIFKPRLETSLPYDSLRADFILR